MLRANGEELEKRAIALSSPAADIQGQLATLWLRLRLDPSSNDRSRDSARADPF